MYLHLLDEGHLIIKFFPIQLLHTKSKTFFVNSTDLRKCANETFTRFINRTDQI